MTGTASGPPSGGLMASILRLLATLSAIGRNRLSLLAVELEEERNRVLAVLAWGAVALLLLVFGLVFVALLLAVVLWDSHRLLALGGIAVAFLAGAGTCWWQATRILRDGGSLFSASLGELAQDQALLGGAEPPAQP
ncbi:MAG: phage holin family protein [Aquabacterium sp.]|jgi:uncharacterized membrane protein YqjE|nr:MAG: phage holin family protein [Aquabacterium sp.]